MRDVLAPKMTSLRRARTVRADRRGRITVRLGRLDESARIAAQLFDPAGRRVGRATVRGLAGRVPAVRVTLDRRVRRLLGRRGTVVLRLRLVLTDTAGNARRLTVRVRVRR